jgi:hypothetical protein
VDALKAHIAIFIPLLLTSDPFKCTHYALDNLNSSRDGFKVKIKPWQIIKLRTMDKTTPQAKSAN